MTTEPAGVVIVGGSLAGVTAAGELRGRGYTGPVTLVGEEPGDAYARPPLSKGVLKGTEADGSIGLPHPGDDVEIRCGVAAVDLDAANRVVTLADGTRLGYEHLIVTTGSRARRFGDAENEYVLRTLPDAARLRTALAAASRIVVVGGGFLGMEVASAARSAGIAVTVCDVRTPLVPVLGEHLGGAIVEAAREHGVRLEICPDGFALVEGRGRVTSVVAADGRRFPADLVVTAIGDEANTGWMRDRGVSLDGAGWIPVDEHARADVPAAQGSVLAAGDVTVSPTPRGVRRLPHWDNAIAQAKTAVATILDGPGAGYTPDPYFWTDAFGIGVKIAGWIPATGDVTEVRGSLADRSGLLSWADGDRQVVAAVNHRIPIGRLKRLAAAPPVVAAT